MPITERPSREAVRTRSTTSFRHVSGAIAASTTKPRPSSAHGLPELTLRIRPRRGCYYRSLSDRRLRDEQILCKELRPRVRVEEAEQAVHDAGRDAVGVVHKNLAVLIIREEAELDDR